MQDWMLFYSTQRSGLLWVCKLFLKWGFFKPYLRKSSSRCLKLITFLNPLLSLRIHGGTTPLHHTSSYGRHHLPPWIRSFDLFRHRRIAMVAWGVHDLFFLEVCSWGRVSEVWCCALFQGVWFSFVCIWVSRLLFQRSLVISLWLRLLLYPGLCIP